jgi:hypothetical protein
MDPQQQNPERKDELTQVKEKIEADAVARLEKELPDRKIMYAQLLASDGQESRAPDTKTVNIVKNIMQDGADEFVKKTGRNMTYAEIREIFG